MRNYAIQRKWAVPVLVVGATLAVGLAFIGKNISDAANVNSSVVVTATAPQMGTISVNGGSNITLSPGTTVSVPVNAQITDYNGCSDFNAGTTTVVLYASTISSSTCSGQAGSGDAYQCYRATAFTTSTCSGSTANTTTTFSIQYFARATDASSTASSSNWRATVTFRAPSGATTTADSSSGSTPDVNTLLSFNLPVSTINYGNVGANNNTGATNQTTTIQNYGNSQAGTYLFGTAMTSGANVMPTSSQLYATSTFNAGSAGAPLSDIQTTQLSGFSLLAPTSTVSVSSTVFWGLSVPGGTPTGTYNATNTFSALFVSS